MAPLSFTSLPKPPPWLVFFFSEGLGREETTGEVTREIVRQR